MPRTVSYDGYLKESLNDRRRAKAYLKTASDDDDPRVFLLALRNVAQAMLSKRGNSSLQSLGALLNSLGFRLTVENKDAA